MGDLLNTRGFGHAAAIQGGITSQQQNDLRARAKRQRVDLYKLFADRYRSEENEFPDLRQLTPVALPAFEALIDKEGARVAPIWEEAERLAVQWYPEQTAQFADRRKRLITALRYRIDGGAPTAISEYSSYEHMRLHWDVEELMAARDGAPLTVKLTWNTNDHDDQVEMLDGADALRARLAGLAADAQTWLDQFERRFGAEDYDVDDVRRDLTHWQERVLTLGAVEVRCGSVSFEVYEKDDDDDFHLLLSARWRASHIGRLDGF